MSKLELYDFIRFDALNFSSLDENFTGSLSPEDVKFQARSQQGLDQLDITSIPADNSELILQALVKSIKDFAIKDPSLKAFVDQESLSGVIDKMQTRPAYSARIHKLINTVFSKFSKPQFNTLVNVLHTSNPVEMIKKCLLAH